MSGENITILEGGKAENFGQVTKLKTSNGSGHDLWVPKTDVETGRLSVKKNGLYYTNQYEPSASEKKDGHAYDIYGWDTITVNVKKKVKGKKKKKKINPDGSISEVDVPVKVEVDDDGNLVETELPTYIQIVKPPNKTEYSDGDTILTQGMVVKAYYADDSEWGTVPLSEIRIDPQTAGGDGDIHTDGHGVFVQKMPFIYQTVTTPDGADEWTGYVANKTWQMGVQEGESMRGVARLYIYGQTEQPPMVYVTRYNGSIYCAVPEGSIGAVAPLVTLWNAYYNNYYFFAATSTARISDKLRRAVSDGYRGIIWDGIAESISNPEGVSINDMHVSEQTITVRWAPDEDEEELEDTFDITVIPSN